MRLTLHATEAERAAPDFPERANRALRAALEEAGVTKGTRGGEVDALREIADQQTRLVAEHLERLATALK